MSEKSDQRGLTKQEIGTLIDNGCSAADWDTIRVAKDFSPLGISNVQFAGNVTIGADVMIRNVSDVIANYDIGDNVIINDVRTLLTCSSPSFGNGVRIAAVNENGGRQVPIFQGLSAQITYLMAMYRHNHELIEKLEAMAAAIVSQKTADQGVVADGAYICNCDVIRNVNIGPGARLHGVGHLWNGTILSDVDASTFVGNDVIAKDFIFAEGSKVADAVRLKRCFVGQGVKLENGFSAVDSVFFANSHLEQGEACSVFAGPFTVSHHKSTLLIAGMFSFYNAGSGTNQSNHMYKLGPAHQGILERGCKTGSESYLMWPSHIGAFTTVVGKHNKRMDLSSLPFSVLLERYGKSELYVGLNLTNVGLVRDRQKWPQRDTRKAKNIADQVNTKIFTPYTVQKMLAGIELLKELGEKHTDADNVLYQGVSLRTPARGIELYQLALNQYFGDVLMDRLDKTTDAPIQQRLATDSDLAQSSWVDIAGLIVPSGLVSDLVTDIKASDVDQVSMIQERFNQMMADFSDYEWAWMANQLHTQLGKPADQWRSDDVKAILNASLEASEKLTALQIEDAAKEFDLSSRISYGIDGDSETQVADFTAVCGSAETNSTIRDLKEELERKRMRVEKIVQVL